MRVKFVLPTRQNEFKNRHTVSSFIYRVQGNLNREKIVLRLLQARMRLLMCIAATAVAAQATTTSSKFSKIAAAPAKENANIVKRLLSDEQTGENLCMWDSGCNTDGSSCAAGLYCYSESGSTLTQCRESPYTEPTSDRPISAALSSLLSFRTKETLTDSSTDSSTVV